MSSLETRNITRDSLLMFADITIAQEPAPVRVKVRNLSAGGMMAEAACPVTRGERLTIDLRNVGKVRGTVAWVQGNRFGIAFESEVDAMLVRTPVAAAETEAPRYARPTLAKPLAGVAGRELRNI